MRVLVPCLVSVEGLGAMRKVASPSPSPSSPALVRPPARSR